MEVKEAYCSKEVCELLREKGFDIEIPTHIDKYGNICYGTCWNWNQASLTYSCPTHQLACAWVRSKGYSVEVHATAVGWVWEVCTVDGILIANSGARDDYDKCTDSALMYALTEVI